MPTMCTGRSRRTSMTRNTSRQGARPWPPPHDADESPRTRLAQAAVSVKIWAPPPPRCLPWDGLLQNPLQGLELCDLAVHLLGDHGGHEPHESRWLEVEREADDGAPAG